MTSDDGRTEIPEDQPDDEAGEGPRRPPRRRGRGGAPAAHRAAGRLARADRVQRPSLARRRAHEEGEGHRGAGGARRGAREGGRRAQEAEAHDRRSHQVHAVVLRVASLCIGALLVAGSGVGLASDAGVTKNRATFQDARSEEPDGPDIASVVVSNGDAGAISFRIDVPSHAAFTDDMGIAVYVDSDHDAATGVTGPGETRGWDYRILWHRLATRSGDPRLLRCDNSRCLSVPGESVGLRFSYSSGARFTILDAELGNTKRFRFSVSVTTGIVRDPATGTPDWEKAKWDFAPELGRTWSYSVRLAPQRLFVRTFAIAQTVAGRTFAVRLSASESPGGAAVTRGRVSCTAAIGGRAIRARSRGFVGWQATCVFAIPANAAGKTIRGTIAIHSQGKTVAKSFARRIR